MPKFTGTVTEKRVVVCQYEVEADDLTEAHEKMARGDTVSETDLRIEGVVDRTVEGSPQEML